MRFLTLTLLAAAAAGSLTPAARPQPPAKAAGPGRIITWHRGEVVAFDPADGKSRTVLLRAESEKDGFIDLAAVTPDGKRAAVHLSRGGVGLYVADLGRREPVPADADRVSGHARAAWSADGAELAVCTNIDTRADQLEATGFVYRPTTGRETPLRWSPGHRLCDWSPDGRTLLTIRFTPGGPVGPGWYGLWLANRDGTPRRPLTADVKDTAEGRFSPDGKRVLATVIPEPKLPPGEPVGRYAPPVAFQLAVIDVATGRGTPVRGIPEGGSPHWACWSPDGTRIAYVWWEQHPLDTPFETPVRAQLIVCDPDGGNPRVVLADKGQALNDHVLRGVSWR